MTHLSPAVFGVWSVSSVLVCPHLLQKLPPLLTSPFAQITAFCFYHIWHYDRFKCLKMNQSPYSGSFKRLMTVRSTHPASGLQTERSPQYTYVLSLPMITIYSVGNAVIKYREGFIFEAGVGGEKL